MPARKSATGVTKHDWGNDPERSSTKQDEAADMLGDSGKGVKVPAPKTGANGSGGKKVSGATRAKGGSI